MIKRKITVKEFIDAVRKNGYEQYFGGLITRNWEGRVGAACAVGQAYLNLGLYPKDNSKNNNYVLFNVTPFGDKVETFAITQNDEKQLPLDEIATLLEEHYSKSLNTIMYEINYEAQTN